MIIIRDPTLANTINDSGIRSLAATRFTQVLMGESYDYNQYGYMNSYIILVETFWHIAFYP